MRMRLRYPLGFLAAVLGLGESHADEKTALKPLKIVTPKPDGVIAIALNGRGDLIGFEWGDDEKNPGLVEQKPFLARGKAMTYLPLLKGYTFTSPAAISDDGVVVGRSSKPAPPETRVYLRNQAFIWDEARGIRGLGALEGDISSFATGISRDGRRIAGFSVGDNRMRACVWDRVDGPEGGWKGTPLPHQGMLNSNVVALSGNGRHAAAVDGFAPCLWTLGDDGRWTRETIGEPSSMVPRSVNDSGVVVGFRIDNLGGSDPVIWTRDGGCRPIPKPPGYKKGEALGVNNAGLVVGMIDGPNGSPIGPNAFAYEGGTLRIIREGGPWFTSATTVNDRGEVAGVFEADEREAVPDVKVAPQIEKSTRKPPAP